MSLDRNLTIYREAYEEANEDFKRIINEAFEAVAEVFRSHNWLVNGDDPSYDLESAIVKFAVISNRNRIKPLSPSGKQTKVKGD